MPIVVLHGADVIADATKAAATGIARAEDRNRADAFTLRKMAAADEASETALNRSHQAEQMRLERGARLALARLDASSSLAREAMIAQARREEQEYEAAGAAQETAEKASTQQDLFALWQQRYSDDPNSPEALDALAKIRAGDTPNFAPRQGRREGLIDLPGARGEEIAASIMAGDVAAFRGRMAQPGSQTELEIGIPEGGFSEAARLARAGIAQIFSLPNATGLIDQLRDGIAELPDEDRAVLEPYLEEQIAAHKREKVEVVGPAIVEMLPDLIRQNYRAFAESARRAGESPALTEEQRAELDAQVIANIEQQTGLTIEELMAISAAEKERKRRALAAQRDFQLAQTQATLEAAQAQPQQQPQQPTRQAAQPGGAPSPYQKPMP